jgi:hypothetical protein
MPQRLTTDKIEQLIRSYHDRGAVTRRAFCEAHQLSASTLDYYLRRHRRSKPQKARFVEVKVKREQPSGGMFALVLTNGRRIECRQAELAQLIRTAESC